MPLDLALELPGGPGEIEVEYVLDAERGVDHGSPRRFDRQVEIPLPEAAAELPHPHVPPAPADIGG